MMRVPDQRVWNLIGCDLQGRGFSVVPGLVGQEACEELAAGYERDQFRSKVIMGRHGFGNGEYQYSRYPLPWRPMMTLLRNWSRS